MPANSQAAVSVELDFASARTRLRQSRPENRNDIRSRSMARKVHTQGWQDERRPQQRDTHASGTNVQLRRAVCLEALFRLPIRLVA